MRKMPDVGAGLAPIGFFNLPLYQLGYESISGGLDVLDGTDGFPHQYPGTPG